MKPRSVVGAVLAVVTSIWMAGATALAFADVSNGSFEIGTFSSAPFDTLVPGSTAIDGWTIESGTIDWIGSYWQASDGSRSIDLSGNDAGALSQTVATTIGIPYVVTFSLSGNPVAGPAAKTLTVSASGAGPITYAFNIAVAGNSLNDMKWVTREYSFVATSASTVVTFTSTTPGVAGPALDNVAVTEAIPPTPSISPSQSVPPSPSISPSQSVAPSPSVSPSPSVRPSPSVAPSLALCKDGGWLTMLDAEGNAFKNQGDCVSYLATDGKNPGAVTP